MKDYVVVTTVSTFRIRYVVPKDKLQATNPDAEVSSEWATDSVVMNEVKEFSQLHLGEQISDVIELDTDELIARFDEDNAYLKDWSREKKLDWINDCWD